MIAFPDRLEAAVVRCQTPVLVGLDPRANMLPPGLLAECDKARPVKIAAAYQQFCREIIDVVARRVPAAMLFLRSPGGLSHHPDEAVLPGDVEAALATGVEFLRRLRDDRAMLERIAARTSPRKRGLHA